MKPQPELWSRAQHARAIEILSKARELYVSKEPGCFTVCYSVGKALDTNNSDHNDAWADILCDEIKSVAPLFGGEPDRYYFWPVEEEAGRLQTIDHMIAEHRRLMRIAKEQP